MTSTYTITKRIINNFKTETTNKSEEGVKYTYIDTQQICSVRVGIYKDHISPSLSVTKGQSSNTLL